MHDGQLFVLVMIGIFTLGGIIKMSIRARHGYPLEDHQHGRRRRNNRDDSPSDERKIALLTNENERLHGQVSRLEERIAVLERIATDPAERTAREIDALRD